MDDWIALIFLAVAASFFFVIFFVSAWSVRVMKIENAGDGKNERSCGHKKTGGR